MNASNPQAQLRSLVVDAVRRCGDEFEISEQNANITRPSSVEHGDYTTNVAMVLAKQKNTKPMELATKIVQYILEKNDDLLEKVEAAAPGFINFSLSKKYFEDIVCSIRKEGERYGGSSSEKDKETPKKAIVEYSSPNIAKPFTIGHLRSTIIGDAVANLLAFSGYQVLRDNHLGDWGTQFGKQIVAIKRWGDEAALDASTNPVHLLVDLYVKFHTEAEKDPSLEEEARAWFVKLEQGDGEARRLWKKCIDWSMVQFQALYDRLGVKFDMMLGESFFMDKMDAVIDDCVKAGIAKESEGALLIFYPNDKYPPLMLRKKDGATLYATRDMATDRYRLHTWGKETLVINEVGAEQRLYFKQLYEAEEMVGYFPKSQRVHVGHGLVRFKTGKMSTRKGNTIWLEDVITEAVHRAAELSPDLAEAVGIGALKYNDLKRECSKEVIFDWDDILNLQGNSGPYIQYAHARACSVLRKAEEKGVALDSAVSGTVEHEPSLFAVEQLLTEFPETIERAAREYAPHHVCTYVFQLAQAFNTFYHQCPIVGSGEQEQYRLLVTSAVAQVLKTGLKLLGIQAPERM